MRLKNEILIAGCGTGQHSIETANLIIAKFSCWPYYQAYFKRKTDEFNVGNVEYMQADILDMARLDKQFDIESSGVLHHMENPLPDGKYWQAALSLADLWKLVYIVN